MARSHNEKRYGVLPADMTVQDWGVSYDQLEPYYDRFEYLCGIGGKAGNLGGKTQAGGNPFAGARGRDYPNPDRKSVAKGKSVSVRVDLGSLRIINKKTIQLIIYTVSRFSQQNISNS